MSKYYPPLGFHFLVEFANQKDEYQFQSVSGLSYNLGTEDITEGGENRFVHKLPLRPKYPNLVLKRGLLIDSELIDWCRSSVEDFSYSPTDIIIKLLNEEHEPLITWNVIHAYPVKWAVADFNAEESKIVIETLELTYNYFKIL
ncbi:MAG TPA: glycerol acyltransferase [Prolixibacteraceae bacterium]|nr:MAG: glycerol acyltransferase [Bacteroidetes bacterium GWB2_41_8]HCY41481.1 glycerol acyltransferase [Prolixibacteraceae bacterium]